MVAQRRMTVLGAMTLIAVVSLGASCGGGSSAAPDSGGGSGSGGGGTTGTAGTGGPAGTPMAQCLEAEETFCKRSVACDRDAGIGDEDSCLRQIKVLFDCQGANTAFTDCLADLKSVSCSTLKTLFEGSCENPFNSIPPSPVQKKCDDLAGAFCSWSARCQNVVATPAELQDCQLEVSFNFDCLFAISVKDQCIADLPTASCNAFDGGADAGSSGPPTPSCDKPITWVE